MIGIERKRERESQGIVLSALPNDDIQIKCYTNSIFHKNFIIVQYMCSLVKSMYLLGWVIFHVFLGLVNVSDLMKRSIIAFGHELLTVLSPGPRIC